MAVDLNENKSIRKVAKDIYYENHSNSNQNKTLLGIRNLYRGVLPTAFGMSIYAGF